MGSRPGANQYRRQEQLAAPAVPLPADLLSQVVPPARRRCQEVWGLPCQAWVRPPSWAHRAHPSEEAKLSAAGRESCPPEVLEMLSHDVDLGLRLEVASNPACPAATLRQLSDEPGAVSLVVAGNPGSPAELLEMLGCDLDMRVRAEVAHNPSSPLVILRRMYRHEGAEVRLGVAANPACPADLLVRMLQDEDRSVAAVAAVHPRLPDHLRAMWQLAH